MPQITGRVYDIGFSGSKGTMWLSAGFRTGTDGVVAPRRVPYAIIGGELPGDVTVDPGPAYLEIDVGVDARGGWPVVIPDHDVTLRELFATVYDWSPSELAEFARLRGEAVDAAGRAEAAADDVETAIGDAAGTVLQAVEGDRLAAEVARAGAESARDTAEGHALAAAGSESAVAASASAAAASASDAASSATAASGSESSASGHAGAAATSAGEASDSADAAATSASQSAGFRDAAEGHASAAGGSADAAAGSAAAAAGSATSAEADADRADAAAAVAQSLRWVPQGDWVAGSYEAGDVVVYDGASYYAGSATSAEPPAAPWVVLSAGGGISDASELTGALTDQVDIAGSVVTMDVGGGPYPYPTGIILQGVAGLDPRVAALESDKSDIGHTHTVDGIEASGVRSASTYLNGTGEFSTPPNTTYAAVTTAAIDAGTEDVGRLTTASRIRHAVQRWVTGSGATPVSAIGQALAAATTAASARATIGAVAASGTAVTLWSGTQVQYDALAPATKNAAGFVAVIS